MRPLETILIAIGVILAVIFAVTLSSFHLIWFIVVGFVVGLLARALLPGRQNIGLLRTTLVGIIGSIIAGWIGRAVGWYGPGDSAGFIMSTIGAVLILAVYMAIMRRRAVLPRRSDQDFPRKAA